MQIVADLATLDARTAYWVPAVTAPERDWRGAPGCRRGARFLIDGETFRPAHNRFPAFATRAECLRWIMEHRAALASAAPDAGIRAARLDAWILGMEGA